MRRRIAAATVATVIGLSIGAAYSDTGFKGGFEALGGIPAKPMTIPELDATSGKFTPDQYNLGLINYYGGYIARVNTINAQWDTYRTGRGYLVLYNKSNNYMYFVWGQDWWAFNTFGDIYNLTSGYRIGANGAIYDNYGRPTGRGYPWYSLILGSGGPLDWGWGHH